MEQNTIILLKGDARLTKNEYRKFAVGDTIYGADSNPTEVKRWGIEQKMEALAELQNINAATAKTASSSTSKNTL